MPHNDTKYTSYLDIANRLADEFPNKSNMLHPLTVAKWCAECETEFIGDVESFRTYVDVPLIVNANRQVLLPCNLYKINDVFGQIGNEESRITYSDNGSYLSFSSNQTFPTDTSGNSIVYINYRGIAIDSETGWPLIKKGHEYACERYVIKKMFIEDFYTGKLQAQVWDDIDIQLSNALSTANRPGRMDNQKMLEIQHIRANMVLKPYMIPLYNMNF